ncbi:MAG: glycosyltransferase, partial [Planctomycetaceae bacterium]|nr:glycosyltransferase [Planctomycetaceae bacterium]
KDDPDLIDTQASYYLKNGLNEYMGLFETNVMVIKPDDQDIASLFTTWWREIEKFSRRDQLALAWALTQHPLKITSILPKGVSVREEKDFIYFTHKDSRSLKVPAEIVAPGHLETPQKGETFYHVKEERLNKIKDTPIDIIVCVYNALEDVKICLNAAREHLLPQHRIIIINDLSDQPTTEFLRTFSADDPQVTLVENETNLGYTRSASLGLATGTADFRILLNSDTIVSENWALKMLDVAQSREDIGIVSPLSNAAGVQSVPEIKSSGAKGLHKAVNVIPDGISNRDIDLFLETISPADITPEVPLVHGFCFGVKKAVIEKIGYFDDVNFERYYGEENDYCMRATAAGFRFAIVTNTFVFNRKARSIVEEERIIHLDKSGKR